MIDIIISYVVDTWYCFEMKALLFKINIIWPDTHNVKGDGVEFYVRCNSHRRRRYNPIFTTVPLSAPIITAGENTHVGNRQSRGVLVATDFVHTSVNQ